MIDNELGFFNDEFDKNEGEEIRPKQTEYIPPDIEQYSEKNKKTAYKKLALIKWLEKRIEGGWTKKNLLPLLDQAQSHFKSELPNWRTVARWYAEYNQSGKAIESLVPKHHLKGRSGRRFSS